VTTTPEENKEILRRWSREVFNAKQVEVIDDLKVPNYADWSRFPGQAPTLESYKKTLRMFFQAFPDFHFTAEETLAEADMGLIRGTWRGTHTGTFMGLTPTGKEVGCRRLDFFKFGEGKMTEHWGAGLELPVLELMGFRPPPLPRTEDEGPRGAARRFFEGLLHQRNPGAAAELFTGAAAEWLPRSLRTVMLQTAIPDAEFVVEHIITEGEKVAIHSTVTGTHLGTYMGIPPTGKTVSVARIDVFHTVGGKILESWHEWDNVSLLVQLGVVGGPPSPSPGPIG